MAFHFLPAHSHLVLSSYFSCMCMPFPADHVNPGLNLNATKVCVKVFLSVNVRVSLSVKVPVNVSVQVNVRVSLSMKVNSVRVSFAQW